MLIALVEYMDALRGFWLFGFAWCRTDLERLGIVLYRVFTTLHKSADNFNHIFEYEMI